MQQCVCVCVCLSTYCVPGLAVSALGEVMIYWESLVESRMYGDPKTKAIRY